MLDDKMLEPAFKALMLTLPGETDLATRFPGAKKGGRARQQDFVPLLLSINCVASGLGWTG